MSEIFTHLAPVDRDLIMGLGAPEEAFTQHEGYWSLDVQMLLDLGWRRSGAALIPPS